MSETSACPFCGSTCSLCYEHSYRGVWQRRFYNCPECKSIHVPSTFHLSPELEKAEYDKHQNLPGDEGYRRFLSRFYDPLIERVAAPAEGLDFGCGPGPVLASMLAEAGYTMTLYDVFYHSDEDALRRQYDFISATEVVEHLADPRAVLDRLWGLLRPGGVLGLMTKRVIDLNAFSNWHYKNDPTHITFFHEHTLRWLADRWQCRYELVGSDVVFFFRPNGPLEASGPDFC